MLELIIIFAVAFLVLPLITLAFAPASTDFYTRMIRFWSIVVIVVTLIILVYLMFFGGVAVKV